jgi:ribosomal protein S5
MTDPRHKAREVLTAAGFTDIGSYNGGATGTKQRFAAIKAYLFIFDGAEVWTAEILHTGAMLGKGADHDPYTALQDAIKAATRRTTSILDILKG